MMSLVVETAITHSNKRHEHFVVALEDRKPSASNKRYRKEPSPVIEVSTGRHRTKEKFSVAVAVNPLLKGEANMEDEVKKRSSTKLFRNNDPNEYYGDVMVIECYDKERLIIQGEMVGQIKKNCEFFCKAFHYGTVEEVTGILRKPDWSISTAKRICQLLTIGHIYAPVTTALGDHATHNDYESFLSAADQMLLLHNILVEHPITQKDITYDTHLVQLMANTWSQIPKHNRFELIIKNMEYHTKLIDFDETLNTWLNHGITLVNALQKQEPQDSQQQYSSHNHIKMDIDDDSLLNKKQPAQQENHGGVVVEFLHNNERSSTQHPFRRRSIQMDYNAPYKHCLVGQKGTPSLHVAIYNTCSILHSLSTFGKQHLCGKDNSSLSPSCPCLDTGASSVPSALSASKSSSIHSSCSASNYASTCNSNDSMVKVKVLNKFKLRLCLRIGSCAALETLTSKLGITTRYRIEGNCYSSRRRARQYEVASFTSTSLTQLSSLFRALKDCMVGKSCFLVLLYPDPTMLGKLIYACQKASVSSAAAQAAQCTNSSDLSYIWHDNVGTTIINDEGTIITSQAGEHTEISSIPSLAFNIKQNCYFRCASYATIAFLINTILEQDSTIINDHCHANATSNAWGWGTPFTIVATKLDAGSITQSLL